MTTARPEDTVAAVERAGVRIETPCGDGAMVWRCWGDGAPLILLHGAFGSWNHWIHNVLPLAEHFRVIVPDMPGYGASAMPPEPYSPESLAEIMVAGLGDVAAETNAPLALAGFSFGGIVAGHVAVCLGEKLTELILIGPNGMALPWMEITDVRGLSPEMTAAEIEAVHRHNLNRLMIADASIIDDLAIYLQIENARTSRVKSGRIPQSDSLLQVLPDISARISGLYGGADSWVGPHMESRRETLGRFQPDLDFRVVPGAGHWVPFEAPNAVNRAIVEIFEVRG